MVRADKSGAQVVAELGGRDLNRDGKIINLVICGNSKFYDYSWLENQLDNWVELYTYPDMIIIGGASGVDYLAERWADNQNIPLAIYSEAWQSPRPNSELDSGRPEAVATLAKEMLEHATHMLAFPGPDSVWTKRMIDIAESLQIPVTRVDLPTEGL
ncbi:MAG: SLOG family protein [Candidatus Thermoplasmatota archaeon]|nr:SLOG family protein [Candidatus Thermoplasmatota archaeon]